jgi:hypothetical protein
MLNPLRATLQGYLTLEEAFLDLPGFENVLFGALMLDMGGNTRTLSPARVFALLQNLKVISSETIQCFMGCSVRHAEKIGITLRVMITAFVRERERGAARGIYRHFASETDGRSTTVTFDQEPRLVA